MTPFDSRLKLTCEMYRINFQRAFRTKPIYRNLFYGTIVSIALYGLIHVFTPRNGMMSLLPHSWQPGLPNGAGRPMDQVSPEVWAQRQQLVKKAFVHAYHGYERYAAPNDELRPLTNGGVNGFNGWGVTAFDSLDTMLMMDLKDEYQRALEIVRNADFTRSQPRFAPFFETVIRYLGGLLSAYALSGDQILLNRAEDLVQSIDPVFDTPSGMPYFAVDPSTGAQRGPKIGILAEIASLQLEYTYLAKLTGKMEYFNRSQAVMNVLASADLKETGGMFPVEWNITSGKPSKYHLSVGAQADSAHEYLLKLYLLTGKTDKASLEMYIRATTSIVTQLLYLSPRRNLLYVTDTDETIFDSAAPPSHVFEHLSCFLPGLLAVGAHTLPLDRLDELGIDLDELGNEKMYGYAGKGYKTLKGYNLKELHMWAAEGLAHTCWVTYADQPTGLGPDEISFLGWGRTPEEESTYLWINALDRWKGSGGRGIVPGLADPEPMIYSEEERLSRNSTRRDYVLRKAEYLLRPETIESLYLLWRVTGDEKWRRRGWGIFEAIERETKTVSGYTILDAVYTMPGTKINGMPSYFLAETLKYLYLMFSDKDRYPLDEWVFNTEAHPFPVFTWTEEERVRFKL